MFGSTAKIGIIVPSLNNTLEPELNQMAPDGVAIYATRLPLEKGVPENLKSMSRDVEIAGEMLKHAEVDVIAFCCTTGSLIEGRNWDEIISERLRKTTSLPVTTTATSIIRAMKKLNLKSVSVATPYIKEVNAIECDFIQKHGIKVRNIEGLNFISGRELHELKQSEAEIFCKNVAKTEADGLFISCTDFASINFIENLEEELNKPVFTSNTATLWDALRMINCNKKIIGFGSLLSNL